MDDGENDTNIELPPDLLRRVKTRVEQTEFETVETYIAFVLEEVVAEVDTEETGETASKQEIHDRLEALGYVSE